MLIDAVVFGTLGFLIGWLIKTYLLSSKGGLGTGGAIGLCAVVWVVAVLVFATLIQGTPDYLWENLLNRAITEQQKHDLSWLPLDRQPVRHNSSSPKAGNAASLLAMGLFIGVRRRKQQVGEKEDHPNTTQRNASVESISYECPNCRKQGSIRKDRDSKCGTSDKPDWIVRCPDCNYIFDERRRRKQEGDEKTKGSTNTQRPDVKNSKTKLYNCEVLADNAADLPNSKEGKIIVVCPKCSNRMRVPNLPEAIRVTCPSCSFKFEVPGDPDTANRSSTRRKGKTKPSSEPLLLSDFEMVDKE